ncbi:MAG: dTMP kinase [Candidatus Sulfotelmatobacter sp.]|jgi:thymidylate kinase
MSPDPLDAQLIATRPFVITFSGIDGAGKTTQIECLSLSLQKQGLRVLRLSFWDDVAVWSKVRAGAGHGSQETGHADPTAERPFAPKNNKHIRKWYLSAARAGLYLLDVARLRRLLASQPAKGSDVVIFDRYIYDQIANLYSQSFAARSYAKILLKRAPAPDLAFILDASPTAAFARKPEYPLEFIHKNRQNFLLLRELVPELIIIPDGRPEDVRSEIHSHISRSRLVAGTLPEEKTEVPEASAVARPLSSRSLRNDPTASL